MDPLTHLTLGACTGEILPGRRFGKKAMLFGALAANLPDIDQIQGWQTKNAPFVLSYPVDDKQSENMIIQKGRLAGWNSRRIRQYLERIACR